MSNKSNDVILDLTRTLGELKGTMEGNVRVNEIMNDNIVKLLEKLSEEVKNNKKKIDSVHQEVESYKNKVKGASWAARFFLALGSFGGGHAILKMMNFLD